MKNLIGLTPAEARKHFPNIRVIKENGARLIVSKDHRKDRLNVAVINGKITEVLGLG